MTEKKEVKKETKKEIIDKAKASVTYGEILEARANRGSMTHQKEFVIGLAKKGKLKAGDSNGIN